MSASPIDHCPVCGYDLREITPPAACPACGFEYDRDTRVWRTAESWSRVAMIYLGFGLLLGLIVLAMEDAATTAFGKTLPLLLALGAPAVGLAFRQSIFGRISGRFVALTPGGIVVGTRGRPRTVTWEEFERLGERRGVPVLYLHESGVQVPLDDIFRDSQELGEFRAALKAAAKSAKQRSGM